MDYKGVSGLLVAIFLTLVSVGLAFGFLVFGRQTQETFEEEVGGGVERGIESLQAGLSISSVNANQITVKNTGRNVLDATKIAVLLDGKRTNASVAAATLNPGDTTSLALTDFVPGVHTIRVTGPAGVGDEGEFGIAPQGVVALWDFEDEDANPEDSVGENDGKLNGSTVAIFHLDEGSGTTAYDATNYKRNSLTNGPIWTAGVSGNALKFDGTDDYTRASGFSELGTSNQPYSFEGWFKAEQGESNGNIIHMSSVDTGGSWCLPPVALVNGNVRALSLNTGFVSAVGTTTVEANKWYHFVNTWDATNGLRIYVNGVLEGTASQPAYTASGASNYVFLSFGTALCGGNMGWFNGVIDEVEVHSRALSASEVKERYEAKRAQFSEYVDGFTSTGILFGGKPQYVNVGDREAFDFGVADFTIESFVRSVSTGQNQVIVEKNDNTNGFEFYKRFTGLLTFWGRTCGVAATAGTVTDGVWHHVAVSRSSSAIRIYLDGVETGSGNCADSISNAASLRIGCNSPEIGCIEQFNGTIDYVAVYNRALSASEIKSIYDAATK